MLKWLSRLFNPKSKSASKKAERKKFIEGLILNHQRRLQILKKHQGLPDSPFVPPHVLMEIEDIEIKIQQLQTELTTCGIKKKAETEAVLAAHQRRLEILRKIEVRHKSGDYRQEIEEIEVKLEQLKAELKQLSS
jgi:hypothetical protein